MSHQAPREAFREWPLTFRAAPGAENSRARVARRCVTRWLSSAPIRRRGENISGAEISAQEFAAECRERLAAIKVPRFVAFVDSLPVTATQRVQKFQLRGDASLRARAIDLSP